MVRRRCCSLRRLTVASACWCVLWSTAICDNSIVSSRELPLREPSSTNDKSSWDKQSHANANHATAATRLDSIHANDASSDLFDLYGFLAVAAPRETQSTTGTPESVCVGTLIHPDALVTSFAHCQDSFAVGRTVKIGDETSVVRHVTRIFRSNQRPSDLMLVFLIKESVAPTAAIWKPNQSPQTHSRNESHAISFDYTDYLFDTAMSISSCRGPSLSAGSDASIQGKDVSSCCGCVREHDNEEALVYAIPEIDSRQVHAHVHGAPLLRDDNSILGVRRGDCGSSDTPKRWASEQPHCWCYSRLSTYSKEIEDALCTWSKFPLQGCVVPPPMASVVTTSRMERSLATSATSTTTAKAGLFARLVQWLLNLFGNTSPSTPPSETPPAPSPVSPVTPVTTPVRRATQTPSMEPTSFTLRPTTAQPVLKQPVRVAPTAPAAPSAPTTCPASLRCPGRNLMHNKCRVQCVAEESVRRKRRAGWNCGQCIY